MTDLQMFLMENPVDNITKEVKLNGRLKDFTFKIKPMTNTEMNRLQKLCVKNPGSKNREFDMQKYNELVVVNNVIVPNFKDAEWLQSSGMPTSEALVNKVLLAGEIAELSDKVAELSGFNTDVEELSEDIKN